MRDVMRDRHEPLVPTRAYPRAARYGATLGAAVLLALVHGVAPVWAQQTASSETLPFGIGEQLTYSARVGGMGKIGKAVMWIEGPTDVRGTSTYVLRFNFKAGIGLVKAEDRTESWLDARRMASLQFHKHERHPLSRHDEKVDMFPDQRRWQGADGEGGASPTDAPLDELSFMYFLRTIPLTADTVFQFNRHFDAARNPTIVRVVRRESVKTGEGEIATVLLEMRVKDPRRYQGEGVIRINISDDDRRLPVRIVSTMPMIGTAALTLESHVSAPKALVAHAF
jgi:hypothetical protein